MKSAVSIAAADQSVSYMEWYQSGRNEPHSKCIVDFGSPFSPDYLFQDRPLSIFGFRLSCLYRLSLLYPAAVQQNNFIWSSTQEAEEVALEMR